MPILKLFRSDLAVLIKVLTGPLIQSARNQLTFDLLLSGCSHCLWIDSNLIFTVQQIQRLLAHDKDIVTGCYAKKNQGSDELDFTGMPLTTPPQVDDDGLMELRYAPAGFYW